MNKILLNNVEAEINNYTRNIHIEEDNCIDEIECSIKTLNHHILDNILETPITLIKIFHDNNLIYTLSDKSFILDTIYEILVDERVDLNIHLKAVNI